MSGVEWSGSNGFDLVGTGIFGLPTGSAGPGWLVSLLGWCLLADERRNQQDEAVQDLLHNDDISLRDWCSINLWRLRRFGGSFSS